MTVYVLSDIISDHRVFAVVVESPEGGRTSDLIIEAIMEEFSAEQVGGIPFTVKDIDWGETKVIEVDIQTEFGDDVRDIAIQKTIAYTD